MKARIALLPRTSEGEACPTPVVWLKVQDRYGALTTLEFRVDTQADVTTIPISLAEREHLPFTTVHAGVARGIAGTVRKYRGRLRVVIAGRHYEWPCDFVESATDPETHLPLRELSSVLGRAGFLQAFDISIKGEYLTVRRVGPLRRWARQRLHEWLKAWGWIHTEGKAL